MIFKTPAEQLRAHLLMIANTDGAPVYWLHVAQIYAELPGRPILLLGRAQSCAILRVQWQERGVIRIAYKEAGLYFEPEADRPLSQFKNPVTGKITPVQPSFREEPATYTYIATDKGVFGNTALDPNRTRQLPWTWGASGPRVWMTDDEAGLWAKAEPPSAKIQQREPLAGRILQTWHADIHDLEDSRITSAPCFKNYMTTTSAWPSWAGDPGERGGAFIRGMGAKLTPKQAAARPEFVRLKQAHADFFADTERA